MFDLDGREQIWSAVASGAVDAEGRLQIGHTVYERGATFHAEYTGMLTATGGSLTGTQVWTRASAAEEITRTCTGILVRVPSERP